MEQSATPYGNFYIPIAIFAIISMIRRMRLFLRFMCVLTCLSVTGCVADRLAFWSKDDLQKDYIVTGLDHDSDTKDFVTAIVTDRFSKAVEGEDAAGLSYRQEAVRRDVLKAMHAKGYYNAAVAYHDKETGEYDITPGEPFRITDISIMPRRYREHLDALDIKAGDPLDAAKILKAQADLYTRLQKDSCAFALDVSHKALLDPDGNGAALRFNITEGRKASFGPVTFSGREKVKEGYLKKLIPWKEGECFRKSKINALQDKLLETRLFSRADVSLPDHADEGGVIPVTIELKERAQRSIRAGLSYYTDEGVGAVLGWEHRNFLGQGEVFNADLTLSMLEQLLEVKLTTPYFIHPDQSLFMNASLGLEDTDAYEKLGLTAGAGVKRSLSKRLSVSVGSDIDITRIKEDGEKDKTFGLVSPYASAVYDSRNNALDPHKGWLLRGAVKPFLDAFGESAPFIKTTLGAQTYYEAHERLVLAARLKMGAITGTNTEDVPATERFFAGGGGSVRGFGFQEVGPFEDNDPAGGRSLVEGALETRFKITDTIGAVAFVDAGHVGDKTSPSFDKLSVGAGAGLRYYTGFGPIRFDIGVPISGKDNTDENFQVYISIGQAF